jgi:hypothetical protein
MLYILHTTMHTTGFFFGGVAAIPAYSACGLQALWFSILLLIGGGVAYVTFIAKHTKLGFLRALMRPVLRPEVYMRQKWSQRSGANRKQSQQQSSNGRANGHANGYEESHSAEDDNYRRPDMV